MTLANFEIGDAIALPSVSHYGIGIIGCGGIVNGAHLPAYTAAGLRVIAVYDQNRETAERTATAFGVPVVADSVEAMLDDPRIDIVDIAVTPWAQPEIALQAIAARRHVLCQKPFAEDIASAERVVTAAELAGVKLAVNQQMRWSAGIRVAGQLVQQGAIGRPAEATIEVHVRTPWHLWPWLATQPRLDIMYHSIHYQDAIRHLFGDPRRVTSRHGRFPGQPEVGETRTLTVFDYSEDFVATVDVNHHHWSSDGFARFRFLGDLGTITGTIGLLADYPAGGTDTLRYQAAAEPSVWHTAALSTRWIPDAFLGPMASLMEAIATGDEPITSGRDNLRTLETVFASYASAGEGRTIDMTG